MSAPDQVLLPAEAARAAIRAELDIIDAAHARLRAADSDLVGNAFRIDVAERLETQQRANRGLSYRMFGEIADPADGPDDPALPADIKVRDLLWQRLRITRGEVLRRFRIAARIRPRRNLTGPPLPPELPEVGSAVEAGDIGEDHIAAITKSLDLLPAKVSRSDRENAERTLVESATSQDANFVTAIGRALADCLNPNGDFTDDDRARRRSLILGRQGPDGMSRLTGCLDPEARAYLGPSLPRSAPVATNPSPTSPATPDHPSNAAMMRSNSRYGTPSSPATWAPTAEYRSPSWSPPGSRISSRPPAPWPIPTFRCPGRRAPGAAAGCRCVI